MTFDTSGKRDTKRPRSMSFRILVPRMAHFCPLAIELEQSIRRGRRGTLLRGVSQTTCQHSRPLVDANSSPRLRSVDRRQFHDCPRLMSIVFAKLMAFKPLPPYTLTTLSR